MPQSFGSLYCHIVFSTKQREAWIKSDVQPRLYEYIGGILHKHSSQLVAAGGMQDHVHLLVSMGRTLSVADAVRTIKSNSSSCMHEAIGLKGFHWQNGYGAFSVSYSNIKQARDYLASQERHHRGMSFQDEFRDFLRRHNLQWDERYVWD